MTDLSYLLYYTILSSIGLIVAVLLGLDRALAKASCSARERTLTLRVASVVLVGWFLATTALAWLDGYRGASHGFPTIQFGILPPIIVGALLIWRSATVARILDAVPQQWLVGVQFYRVLGVVFVVLYAAGSLPAAFALPAGLGDLAVGLLAPVVAWTYARAPAQNAGLVRSWNGLGIADLVLAFITGFLTTPSPLQLFARNAPNLLIDSFPLVLIPVFLVPLSIVLHIASLAKLRREHASGSHPDRAATASA